MGGDWLALAQARADAGRDETARQALREAARFPPERPVALALLTRQRCAAGEAAAAYAELAAARAADPALAVLELDLAEAAAAAGEPDAARSWLAGLPPAMAAGIRALRLAARLAEWSGAGSEATAAHTAVCARADASADDLYRAAEHARHCGDLALAATRAQQVLARTPGHAAARICLAACHALDGEITAAQALLDQVHRDTPAAFMDYTGRDRPPAAPPDARVIHLLGFFQRLLVADWRDYDRHLAIAADALDPAGPVVSDLAAAFPTLYLPLASATSSAVHAAVSHDVGLATTPCVRPPQGEGERLRVGYLATKFRFHPAMILAHGLFRAHDRRAVEVFGYALNADEGDPVRRVAAAEFDHFVDLAALDDRAAAARIAADGIDVLVDLNGYGDDARPAVLAARPAAVQVSYLGYQHSLFAPWIDYRLTDRVSEPEHWGQPLREARVYLPGSFFTYGAPPPPAAAIAPRDAHGLPEDGLVLAAFTRPEKIEPAIFAQWLDLLRELPGAVLWLLEDRHGGHERLCASAVAAGLPRERLVVAPRVAHPDHLLRHRAADLCLDTFTCNGHTTTLDALHAGLPVLTCRGQRWGARIGASLLAVVGLDELVATDGADYRARALALGRDRPRLAALAADLRARMAAGSPFAPRHLAPRLEQAYRRVTQRARAGLPPADLDLAAD